MEAPVSNRAGTVSLVLGIFSFCVPIVLGIPAIVLGLVGLRRPINRKRSGAGLILGVASSALAIYLVLAIVVPLINLVNDREVKELAAAGVDGVIVDPTVKQQFSNLGVDMTAIECNTKPNITLTELSVDCSAPALDGTTKPVKAECENDPAAIKARRLECTATIDDTVIPVTLAINSNGNATITAR